MTLLFSRENNQTDILDWLWTFRRTFSPHQTGRPCLQSSESVQGRRAADPLHQQQPGETGHTSGGQAGRRNHDKSEGVVADPLLGEAICKSWKNFNSGS